MMTGSKKHSVLFRKYFFMISLIVLVAYFVLVAAFTGTYIYNFVEEKEHTLWSNASIVVDQVEKYFTRESLNYFDENKEHIPAFICDTILQLSKATNSDIFVCNINGNVVLCKEMMKNNMAVSDVDECDIHRNYRITLKTIQHASEHSIGDYGLGKLDDVLPEKCVIASKPIFIDNEFKGIVFAVQSLNLSLGKSVLNVLKLLLISGALALFTAFIGAYNIATQLTKPLSEMSKAVKSYALGDFSIRIPVTKTKNNDELNRLVIAINAMAQSLSVSEESNRSFVANVSHELKTPMTTIGGFIDGILDGTIPQEKEKYYLNIVSSEVKRLTNLVKSMLNLSKIEAGKVEVHQDNFNLSSMVVTTLLSFEKKIEENNIKVLGFDLFDDVFVNADEGMINQVIYNYIDNAVKFTPKNGTISFRMEKNDDKIWVFIRNTGDGISSENLSRVFERFYKVDSSRSNDVKGTGLGLYLVKTIVELHGGTVGAESVEGQYAEFSFCLPI